MPDTTRDLDTGWTHLEPRGEREVSDIRPLAIASARLTADRFVTVVRDANNYGVLVWEVAYDGAVKVLGRAAGGPTTRVAVTAIPNAMPKFGHTVFVTAARTEAGQLKVTAWDVDKAGGITRQGSAETGGIRGEFAIASAFGLTFVTAVRDSTDRLTLISWWLTANRSIERLETARAEEVRQIALATYDSYPPAVFPIVTAVTTPSRMQTNDLKLIAWRVDEAGVFSRAGDVKGGPVSNVAAVSLSHRRIVTAARSLQSQLELRTWDFDQQGQISEHAANEPTGLGDGEFGVATLNAAHAITAVPDGGGRLTLISWDAVDKLVRLGHARKGQADLISVLSLGSDWLVTPVRTERGTLKVITWVEHGVSLLRGEWSGIPHRPSAARASTAAFPGDLTSREDEPRRRAEPDLTAEKSGDDGAPESPMVSDVYLPGIEGFDAMVSVGFNYVIVSQDHEIGIFDKQMNQLGQVSSEEFFASFLGGTRADSSRNEDAINRHLGFEPGSAMEQFPPGALVYCDPDDTGRRPVCVSGDDAFFDVRSHFDRASRRFFIAAGVRPGCKNVLKATGACTRNSDSNGVNTNKDDNPLVRRYFAFAVSKTEDPRDGFYQWITTEAGRSYDHPRTAVNKDVMVVTAGPSASTLQTHPFGMKPKLFVFSVEDMLQGKRYVRSHKYFPPEMLIPIEAKLIPLRHYGNTGERTFFVRPDAAAKTVFVLSFRHPSDWTEFPPIEVAFKAADVGVEVSIPDDTGFFRDGKIYFAWHKAHKEDQDTNNDGTIDWRDRNRYSIRLVCVPLLALTSNPVPSVNPADGFFYRVFGIRSPADGAGDLLSYMRPDVVVNRDGHVVVSFARVGWNVSVFPEARYRVFYADGRGDQSSRLLRAGEVHACRGAGGVSGLSDVRDRSPPTTARCGSCPCSGRKRPTGIEPWSEG